MGVLKKIPAIENNKSPEDLTPKPRKRPVAREKPKSLEEDEEKRAITKSTTRGEDEWIMLDKLDKLRDSIWTTGNNTVWGKDGFRYISVYRCTTLINQMNNALIDLTMYRDKWLDKKPKPEKKPEPKPAPAKPKKDKTKKAKKAATAKRTVAKSVSRVAKLAKAITIASRKPTLPARKRGRPPKAKK